MFKEIASILNIESADTHTPGWFQLRTKASKNVINAMAEDERKDLEIAADRMQKDGMPPDIQRRYVSVLLIVGLMIPGGLAVFGRFIFQIN